MTRDQMPDGVDAEEVRLATQAKLLRARADVVKAQSELDSARTPPDLLGSVTSLANGPTGTIKLSDGAGKAETTLLGAWACNVAARRVATAVRRHVCDRPVAVVAGADLPSFFNYELFDMRVQGLRRTLQRAEALAAAAAERGDTLRPPSTLPGSGERRARPLEDAMSPFAVVGTALDLMSKLGTYLQSDYELGGWTIAPDDDQFLAAVAGQNFPRGLSLPQKVIAPRDSLKPLLADLDEGVIALGRQALGLQREAAKSRSDSDAEPEARKAALLASAAAYEDPLPQLKEIATTYDDLIKGLSVVDPAGRTFGAKVAQERAVFAALFEGDCLILRVDMRASVGAWFTKKNIWTFLGTMPFYAMGGAVFTYTLMDPKTGAVAASGLEPIHSGYLKLSAIQALFEEATLWFR